MKKGGAGKHNWGTPVDEEIVEAALDNVNETKPEAKIRIAKQ